MAFASGLAMLVAVLLVAIIVQVNDIIKEDGFRLLYRRFEDDKQTCVVRDSRITKIHPRELVVGDIVFLQVGI